MTPLKFCPKCKEWKEATTVNFCLSNFSKDSFQSWCKLCNRAYVTARNRAKGMKPRPKLDAATRKANRATYDQVYHAAHSKERAERKRLKLLEQKALQPPKPPKPKKERQRPAPVVLPVEIQRHIDYFINAKAVREERTLTGYRVVLRMFGQYIGDKDPTGRIWPPDSDDINGFLAAAKKRGCKDTSLFDYWRLLRNWFTWLHKRGKIADNPILLTEKPASSKKLPRAPKEEDLKRLFAQLRAEVEKRGGEGVRNLALITLALDTGMREGELVKLTLADLDLEQCRIIVRETKTDRERYVVITPHACQTLTGWLKVRPSHASDRLFTSRQKRDGLTGPGAAEALKKALKRAGAAHFGLHALRHAYAIYTLRNGGNLLDIQKQLGHTNIATTARYLLVADDDKRADRHALTSPVNGLLGGAP